MKQISGGLSGSWRRHSSTAMAIMLTGMFISFTAHAQGKSEAVLSESISAILYRIGNEGITREAAAGRDIKAYSSPLVRLDERGRVHIYIYLSAMGVEVLDSLRELELEMEIQNEELKVIQGWAPFDRLEEIADLPFVLRITPPGYGTPMSGSVQTEGDAILKADQLRSLGLDGSGVRIGVISDGANDRATAQATGDLPENIKSYGACSVRDGDKATCLSPNTCNEGTAMLEIIHDIAPGAELAIAAVNTSLEFIERIDELVSDFGADVIVDDLGFLGEPYFADGPIAQAVAAVTDRVVFISAAGNHAQHHHEANYWSTTLQGYPAHDFAHTGDTPPDATLDITVKPDSFLLVVLQWNDEFGKSANDYDLLLVKEDESAVLCPSCGSVMTQNGSQDPIEAVCYNNDTNSPVRAKVVVPKYQGFDRRLKLYTSIRGVTLEEYGTAESSITGHPGLSGVVAVGAIDAADPEHDEVQKYSSRGPARIDFPNFRSLVKPDVVAIDGVSVTGVGGFPSLFYGPSAAAPHVAGVAGLLLDAAPAMTPEQVRSDLMSEAVDLADFGQDNESGWGRVDGVALAQRYADTDSDEVYDHGDNCLLTPNPAQENNDADSLGDACDPDDDNDSIPDTYEIAHGLDSLDAGDALGDLDGDGLGNVDEFLHDTAADRPDTDNDGMNDHAEIVLGRNPTVNEAAVILLINGMAE